LTSGSGEWVGTAGTDEKMNPHFYGHGKPMKTMIYYEILRQPWATLFLGEPTQGDMAKSNRFNIDMPDIMGMVASHGPLPPW